MIVQKGSPYELLKTAANKKLYQQFIKKYKAGKPTPQYIKDNPELNEKFQSFLKSFKAERKASGTKHLGTKQKKQYGGPVRKAKY